MSGETLNATEIKSSGEVPEVAAVTADEHTGDKNKKEIGGREGPDPTRFGDWEKNGRCIDF